jgi:hypothetical protein
MRLFHDWLDCVLTSGESVQDAPPWFAPAERPAIETRLRAAFELHTLDIAGPPIAFDSETAIRAAVELARACWALVSAADDDSRIALPAANTPAAHLSADLTLRFLPNAYRRARLRVPDGPLTKSLDCLLRAWPLSGVLADLDGTPTLAPDFGHAGLQLLYAERLVNTRRAGWVPPDGAAREWTERVFAEAGLSLPEPLKDGSSQVSSSGVPS